MRIPVLALTLLCSSLAQADDELVGQIAWDPATREEVVICRVDGDGTIYVSWSCKGIPRPKGLPRQRSEINLSVPELDGVKALESYVLWFGGKPTAHWVLSKAWRVYEDHSVRVADSDDSPIFPRPADIWKVEMSELLKEVPAYESFVKDGLACAASDVNQNIWVGKRFKIQAIFENGLAALMEDTWITRHVREASPTTLFDLRDFKLCENR